MQPFLLVSAQVSRVDALSNFQAFVMVYKIVPLTGRKGRQTGLPIKTQQSNPQGTPNTEKKSTFRKSVPEQSEILGQNLGEGDKM